MEVINFGSMNKIAFAIVILLSISCAGPTPVERSTSRAFDRNKLVETAKLELKLRGFMLPTHYDVAVTQGQIITEIEPRREIYVVTFRFIYRGKKDIVYTVHIDKRSGKVKDVYDSRTSIPSKV
jgi:hypothetical protein